MFILVASAIFFVAIGVFLTLLIIVAKKTLIGSDACKIKVNEEIEKEVEGGKTLLNALLDSGFGIPCPCGGKATCHQCKVQVVGGGGEVLETDRAIFTPKELKEGWRLSCQCKVKGDIAIALPSSQISAKRFSGKVISNRNVATFIKELVVELPEDVEYIPGDYLQFYVPRYETNTSLWKMGMEDKYHKDWDLFGLFGKEIIFNPIEETIRAYSLASYPREGRVIKFNVRIASPPLKNGKIDTKVPWGICSSYLFSLAGGEEIEFSGPYGESHMIEDERPLYFLIGGAGSSFGRAHIFDLFYNQGTNRHVELWYGARSLKENIYQEEYETLSSEHQNFSYHVALSDPLEEDFAAGWPKGDPLKTNYLYNVTFKNIS